MGLGFATTPSTLHRALCPRENPKFAVYEWVSLCRTNLNPDIFLTQRLMAGDLMEKRMILLVDRTPRAIISKAAKAIRGRH